MQLTGRRARAGLAALLATAVIAACGGDDASGAGSDPTDAGGGGEAPAELTDVTVSVGGLSMLWMPVYVADQLGLYEEHGLDVEIAVSSSGTQGSVAAVLSGDALVGGVGAPAAITAAANGAPLEIVQVVSTGYGVDIAASNAFLEEAGVSPDDPIEDRVKALADAKLGIVTQGDSTDNFFRFLAESYGLDPADTTTVPIGEGGSRLAAIQNGSVDALAASVGEGERIEAAGSGQILIGGTEPESLALYPFLIVFASRSSLDSKADDIERFMAATAEAVERLREDGEVGRTIMREVLADMDQETFDATYQAVVSRLPADTSITQEAFDQLAGFNEFVGTPLTATYEDLVETLG